MPFSSGRSVRAPASNATRIVVARVPSSATRWIGRPLGATEELICGIAPDDSGTAFDLTRARRRALDEHDLVQPPPVYTAGECRELAAMFDEGRFRSTIEMRRYRFGEGEYKYFDAPLPELIDEARHALYPPLAAVANAWAQRLGEDADLPPRLDDFLE